MLSGLCVLGAGSRSALYQSKQLLHSSRGIGSADRCFAGCNADAGPMGFEDEHEEESWDICSFHSWGMVIWYP